MKSRGLQSDELVERAADAAGTEDRSNPSEYVSASSLAAQSDFATPEDWPLGTGSHAVAQRRPATSPVRVPSSPKGLERSSERPSNQRRATTAAAPPEQDEDTIEESKKYADSMARLESEFETAVSAIQMVFQPIVHARDYAIFGYEALLRSKHPALPHPGALLDAAERLNRTAKLGRHIRAQVARVFSAADESRGLLFVNLHALDLLDKSLSSRFSPLAKIAHRVVLEVTERASLESVSDIRYRVAELREMGYRIAIDDLGAGHSRMNLFTPLDTDLVKLDMSLVRDIDSHPMKQELVSSVVKLCRDQGILVIGEGVETEAEADYLRQIDCDLLQGYLIAKPAPPFVVPTRRKAS